MNLVSGIKSEANGIGNSSNSTVPVRDTSPATPQLSDALIIEAWERLVTAYTEYSALPSDTGEDVGKDGYTPSERALWETMDAAELVIQSNRATSLQGIQIQLWTSLCHSLTDRHDDAAARRMDLGWFDARDDEFDWSDRLLLAALRSLKEMEASNA